MDPNNQNPSAPGAVPMPVFNDSNNVSTDTTTPVAPIKEDAWVSGGGDQPPAAPSLPKYEQPISQYPSSNPVLGNEGGNKKKSNMGPIAGIAALVLLIGAFAGGAFFLTQRTSNLAENLDDRSRAGEGSCPDGSGNAAWCATWNCPNGDQNGDGQCTSDDGAGPSIGGGAGCGAPSSGCGQTDVYKEGPAGQNWGSFCGTTFHSFDNCGGGSSSGGSSSGGQQPKPDCKDVRVLKQNDAGAWEQVRGRDLDTLTPGTAVRFIVKGENGNFKRARFKINDAAEWTETNDKEDGWFYINYTIPADATKISVRANVYGS